VSAQLAALLAGLLGLPAGTLARKVARAHCRRPAHATLGAPEEADLGAPEGGDLGTREEAHQDRHAPLPEGPDRDRRVPVPLRPPLTELATATLWALLALRLWRSHPAAVPAYLALGFACVALVAVDLDSKLLPNRITYPALALVAALLLAASLAEHDLGRMARALAAAAVAAALLLALALISPGGMGLGDVKFALVLGLALGWLGWEAVAAGLIGAFLLGGLAALAALLVLRADRKTQIPFGPWLALGAILAVLAAAPRPPS
jgi:leader peptidase (prepilin peptidase)/N-methyltransferase